MVKTPTDLTKTAQAGTPPHLEVTDRFTVNLIPKAHACMAELRSWLRLNKTDIVNRALTLYHFVEAENRAGKKVMILDPDGTLVEVKFL